MFDLKAIELWPCGRRDNNKTSKHNNSLHIKPKQDKTPETISVNVSEYRIFAETGLPVREGFFKWNIISIFWTH